jgi:superfamily II DNA helicase RecQ
MTLILFVKNIQFQLTHSIKYSITSIITALKDCKVTVVLASPEALLGSEVWCKWLRQFRNRICLLTFDEAHVIPQWYEVAQFATALPTFHISLIK